MSDYLVLSPDGTTPRAKRAHGREAVWALLDHAERPVADPPAFEWEVPKGSEPTGWCPTVDRVRVISPVMLELLEEHRRQADKIQWIPCTLRHPDGCSSSEWRVLHFAGSLEVLDEDLTTWGPSGLPQRWVLSRAKVADRSVFGVPGAQNQLVVTDTVFDKLSAQGLARGLTATPARIN